jgi:hypothetical protein
MWSSAAAVLAFVGVAAAFMVGDDDEPLALSPRAAKLTALSGTALLAAAALALTGLASWRWMGETAGWSGVLGTGRLVHGWLRRGDLWETDLDRRSASNEEPVPPTPAPPDRLPDVWQILPRR